MSGFSIFCRFLSKKLKEQDYSGITPRITQKTVKIYLSRDTQPGLELENSTYNSTKPHKASGPDKK